MLAGVLVLAGGDPYKVRVRLTNASQLVKGNLVTVAGEKVGLIEDIALTDDGQAELELTISDEFAPLRTGTRAVVRQQSLSGVANRYVELQLGGAGGRDIQDGATIPAADTQANVDLDQLFNTFDEPTRKGLGDSFRFFRDLNRGRERQARRALVYLSPALYASSRLFGELDRNRKDFERFVVATSGLVTDLAARDDDLAGLVGHLSTTLGALSAQRDDLGAAIDLLPSFMRRANSTFVNLRATLGDLDPLVRESKPVVRDKLRPLFAQLRPFVTAAAPTVRDLSRAIRSPGDDNDLIELLNAQPAVDRIANDRAQRNGAQRPGAFDAMQAAARGATPQLAFLRPYSVDLVGWFDDFSSSGVYDALGSFSRAGLQLNQFTFTPTVNELLPVPPELRDELTFGTLQVGRNNRCPGSAERAAPDGSNPYRPSPDFACDPTQVPAGP